MLQLHHLAAQADVDRHHDLLDRAEAIGLMRPLIARQIEKLVGRQQFPRPPVNDLLIGRGRRLRAAAGLVDQQFDRGAIDDIETDNVAAAVAPQFESRGVEHQEILKELAQPGRERPLAIGLRQNSVSVAIRSCRPPWLLLVARSDRPVELFDLVLASLDRQPSDVVAVGQRAQLVKYTGSYERGV